MILLPILIRRMSLMASVPQSIAKGGANTTSLDLSALMTKGMNGSKKASSLKICFGTTLRMQGASGVSSHPV